MLFHGTVWIKKTVMILSYLTASLYFPLISPDLRRLVLKPRSLACYKSIKSRDPFFYHGSYLNFIPSPNTLFMGTNSQGNEEKTFQSFGKKVDRFVVELNEAAERLEKEFQQKYEELKQSAEKLKKEAENKETWKEVESSLKKASEELKQAFNAAFKKRS